MEFKAQFYKGLSAHFIITKDGVSIGNIEIPTIPFEKLSSADISIRLDYVHETIEYIVQKVMDTITKSTATVSTPYAATVQHVIEQIKGIMDAPEKAIHEYRKNHMIRSKRFKKKRAEDMVEFIMQNIPDNVECTVGKTPTITITHNDAKVKINVGDWIVLTNNGKLLKYDNTTYRETYEQVS